MTPPPARLVCYLDDDSSERELVRASIATLDSGGWLVTLASITEAQTFLTDSFLGFHQGPGKPCLLLLDYNLGPQSGLEMLAWLKSQSFCSLPVAMFSNCDCEDDILACYQAGALYYLHKPSSFKRLQEFLVTLQSCLAGEHVDFDRLRLLEEYRGISSGDQGSYLKPELAT